jgi:hypothetical protein
MAISATCPHCGHHYNLDDSLAGRKGKCKVCKQLFPIPSAPRKTEERTAGGIPVVRAPEKPKAAAAADEVPAVTPYLKQIERHIEKTIGPAPLVFHEIVSEDIHLDLYIVPPTNQEPSEEHPMGTFHYTVVTAGLSAKPQAVPAEAREDISPFQELMIAVPGDWPGMKPDGSFDKAVMKDDANWWPFGFLKMVARMPSEYETFLAPGVTIPNGEAAEPFAANTKLGCMMVFPPMLSPEANTLQISDALNIQFWALWPLYPEEMKLKLDKGLEPLLTKIGEAEITELIQVDRPNLCKKKGWFGFGR